MSFFFFLWADNPKKNLSATRRDLIEIPCSQSIYLYFLTFGILGYKIRKGWIYYMKIVVDWSLNQFTVAIINYDSPQHAFLSETKDPLKITMGSYHYTQLNIYFFGQYLFLFPIDHFFSFVTTKNYTSFIRFSFYNYWLCFCSLWGMPNSTWLEFSQAPETLTKPCVNFLYRIQFRQKLY